MSFYWKEETRAHYRLVWCQNCPWNKIIMGGLVSHTHATKHSIKNKHEVVVINLNQLEEEHRYKTVIVEQPELPPF